MTKYKLEYIWLDGYTPVPNRPPVPGRRAGTGFEAQVFQAFPYWPAFGNMRRGHSFSRRNFASGFRMPVSVEPKINSYAQ